jgi:hypothetical protein
MDDPNDFEWGFPKAKNRASNGTLYDNGSITPALSATTFRLGPKNYFSVEPVLSM